MGLITVVNDRMEDKGDLTGGRIVHSEYKVCLSSRDHVTVICTKIAATMLVLLLTIHLFILFTAISSEFVQSFIGIREAMVKHYSKLNELLAHESTIYLICTRRSLIKNKNWSMCMYCQFTYIYMYIIRYNCQLTEVSTSSDYLRSDLPNDQQSNYS